MFSIALRFLLIEREENINAKAIRRQLRDSSNPLELSDSLFLQYYRLNKPAFKYLLDILTNSLPPLKQKFGVPPIVKLSACVRFFAEGGYQKSVGKDHEVGLSQSCFSEVLSEVLNILQPLLYPQWITWPTLEEERQTAHDFYAKFGIPGVVGCVDGTHVNIATPSKNVHQFYNRKGKCSLNFMLVMTAI
ncbi:putative nuclease HARBI1 [Eurosta solidaginis]|uniref:putative nuclease HARBI1 n=1 Tax=Eurosta solidaginis TaxID=178769 RepID=UPI00353095F2